MGRTGARTVSRRIATQDGSRSGPRPRRHASGNGRVTMGTHACRSARRGHALTVVACFRVPHTQLTVLIVNGTAHQEGVEKTVSRRRRREDVLILSQAKPLIDRLNHFFDAIETCIYVRLQRRESCSPGEFRLLVWHGGVCLRRLRVARCR